MEKLPLLANFLITSLLVVTPGNSDESDADDKDMDVESQESQGDVTLRLSFVESAFFAILRETQPLHICGSQMRKVGTQNFCLPQNQVHLCTSWMCAFKWRTQLYRFLIYSHPGKTQTRTVAITSAFGGVSWVQEKTTLHDLTVPNEDDVVEGNATAFF
jgi:hypothetical protein